MSKITVGRKRNTDAHRVDSYRREGNILFAVGIAVMCIMLILPMTGKDTAVNSFGEDAVAVMSNGVVNEAREELARPDKDTSAQEEWSIYDYIGQMFAELIFGDR